MIGWHGTAWVFSSGGGTLPTCMRNNLVDVWLVQPVALSNGAISASSSCGLVEIEGTLISAVQVKFVRTKLH